LLAPAATTGKMATSYNNPLKKFKYGFVDVYPLPWSPD
jgi:hypothetical protein